MQYCVWGEGGDQARACPGEGVYHLASDFLLYAIRNGKHEKWAAEKKNETQRRNQRKGGENRRASTPHTQKKTLPNMREFMRG